MSTGIGGKCHFVCFLFVLCIVLTSPQIMELLLKKKKEKVKSLITTVYLFFCPIPHMKTYNPNKWNMLSNS